MWEKAEIIRFIRRFSENRFFFRFSIKVINFLEKDIDGQKSLVVDYERAVLDLVKLKRENNRLQKLLEDKSQEEEEIGRKLEDVRPKLRSKFEIKQITARSRKAGSEVPSGYEAAPFPGFSMEHEVTMNILFASQVLKIK